MLRFLALLAILLLLNACGSADTIAAPTIPVASMRPAQLLATVVPSDLPATTPRSLASPSLLVPATATPRWTPTPRLKPVSATRTPQPQSFTSPITSVSFVDDQHGWLAVDDHILQTSDGGTQWAVLVTMPGPLKLAFISLTDGWLSAHGRLFTTHDGGTTWHPLTQAPSEIRWIGFGDARTGWAYTKDGLAHTIDGGITWSRATPPCGDSEPSGPLHVRTNSVVWMTCPLIGILGMRPNELYRSNDDGTTWQLISAYNLERPQPNGLSNGGFAAAITFVDSDQGWAITNSYLYPGAGGHYGSLAYTRDGGTTWHQIPHGPAGEYLHLAFTSPQHGYLVAHTIVATTLYQTNDGGTTWQPIYQAPPGDAATG